MRLVVTDANIIIDLDAGGLLEEIFRLPDMEFCTPDVLYLEELAQNYGALPALGLKVVSQPPEAVEYVTQLRPRYRRPSTNDLFALALARAMRCPLLSGDGSLRVAAETEGVEIHGTLWLIEALLQARLVGVGKVALAYEGMRRDGSRLPWEDVEAQIRHWQEIDPRHE
jgi:hypothetical protein